MNTTVLLISHTHWDRQWYRTVQEFRMELVPMMDRLIRLLKEDPGFEVFHFDGQTAAVEDYLELRPEMKPVVEELVAGGKLKIGPWYLQPDTFLVSGEGLIRNLMRGTSYAESMGGALRIGWLPDSFGHTAQLPQILRGFGIESFIFSRGLGDHLEREALEFLWRAPNGDEVLALLQLGGYYSGGNLAYPFFWGDITRIEPDHDTAVSKLSTIVSASEDKRASEIIPVWNGSDHMAPERSLSATVEYANGRMRGYRVEQGAAERYVEAVAAHRGKLQQVSGELRGARHEAILAGILSSRIHLKQRNYRLERALARETEPLLALSWCLGGDYPAYALADAWDEVLKTHFHDSIGGCSVDQAHREMECNFSAADQTVRMLTRNAMGHMVTRLNPEAKAYGSAYRHGAPMDIMLFNPVTQPYTGVLETTLDLPYPLQEPSAYMSDGSSVPLQLRASEEVTDMWIPHLATAGHIRAELPWWHEYLRYIERRSLTDYRIDTSGNMPSLELKCGDTSLEDRAIVSAIIDDLAAFPADAAFTIRATFVRLKVLLPANLPAYGYTTLYLTHEPDAEGRQRSGSPETGEPLQPFQPVQTGDGWMENRFLRVEVREGGEIDLLDKRTGLRYPDLHSFQDQADRGDTYDFCPVSAEDERNTILTPLSVSMQACETGPARACIAVTYRFQIPKNLHQDVRDLRSNQTVIYRLETRVYLAWEAPYVEFQTVVFNNAKDHRLRVYAGADIRAEGVFSDGQFSVQERRLAVEPGEGWAVPPPPVFPHERWVAVSDGSKGLALLTEGMHEHQVVRDGSRSHIALTLLRCVGWLSRQDLFTRPGQGGPPIPTPDAQCQGRYSFRYALYPFAGDARLQVSGIIEAAQHFDARPSARLLREPPTEELQDFSALELRPGYLQMSAVKRTEDGRALCLRFHNPADSMVQAVVEGALRVESVWRARADETPLEQLASASSPEGMRIEMEVPAAQIVTLLLYPRSAEH